MADKRPTKTKLPETKIDLELPTSKGELVPYKKPEGGLSDTSQGKRATRNIAKGRGSAKRRALSALLEILLGAAVDTEPLPGPEIDRRTVLKGLTSLVTPDIPFKLGATPTPKPELLELGTEVLGKQLGSSWYGGLPEWMQAIKLDESEESWATSFREDLNDEVRQFEGTATGQDPDTWDLLQYDTVQGPDWGKEVIKTILSPEGSGVHPPEKSMIEEKEDFIRRYGHDEELMKDGVEVAMNAMRIGSPNRQEQRQSINKTLKEVVDTIYSPHTPKKIRDRLISNPFGVEISNMKKQGISQKEIYKLLSKNNPGFKDITNSPDWLPQDMIPFKHVETPEGSDHFIPLHALEFIGLRNLKENKDILEEVDTAIRSNHPSFIDYIRDIGWLEPGYPSHTRSGLSRKIFDERYKRQVLGIKNPKGYVHVRNKR